MPGYRYLVPLQPYYYSPPASTTQSVCALVQQHDASIRVLRKSLDQQGTGIAAVRKSLDEHGATVTSLRNLLEQQGLALKDLEKTVRALPASDQRVPGLVIANT